MQHGYHFQNISVASTDSASPSVFCSVDKLIVCVTKLCYTGSFIRGHASLNCILSDNINPFCCFHKVCYRLLLLTSCILNSYLFFLHQAQQMLCFSGSVNILCDDSSDATWVSVPIKFAVWKSSSTVCDATTSFIFHQEIS